MADMRCNTTLFGGVKWVKSAGQQGFSGVYGHCMTCVATQQLSDDDNHCPATTFGGLSDRWEKLLDLHRCTLVDTAIVCPMDEDMHEAEQRPTARTWAHRVAEALARYHCPYSGLRLWRDGEGLPGTLSCGVCDCFGFDPAEVGTQ